MPTKGSRKRDATQSRISVLPFHRDVLDHADFIARYGFAVHTAWIETTFADRTPPQSLAAEPVEVEVFSSWIEVDGKRMSPRLAASPTDSFGLGGGHRPAAQATSTDALVADDDVLSPMADMLMRWAVNDGAAIPRGDTIAVVEAMKMETTVTAPMAGHVQHADDAPASREPLSPSTVRARISPARS